MSKRMLLKDAAKELGLTYHALYNMVRAKQIPHFRVGNRYILDIEQVDEFLKNLALQTIEEQKEAMFPPQKLYGWHKRIV